MRLDLVHYGLPFVRPLHTAAGTVVVREGWLVRVEADGHIGWGDAAPLPGFSDETVAETEAALRSWVPRAPAHPEEVEALDLPTLPSARHGVEQALLDWLAGRLGASLPALLNDACADEVAVNALANTAEQARQAVDAGARCVKVKVATAGVDADLQRAHDIRDAVGPDVALRFDANQGWSESDAILAIQELHSLRPELLEEPVADLQVMARLRGVIPLGADEHCRDEADLNQVLALSAADVIVVKPMLVGGLQRALRMLRRASDQGLRGLVTTALESAVGRSGALAVALAAPNVLPCGLDTGRWLAADVGPGFAVLGGVTRWAGQVTPWP